MKGTERWCNERRLPLPGRAKFVRRIVLARRTLSLFAMAAILPIWLVGCGTGVSPTAGKAPSSLNTPGAKCSTAPGVPATPTSVPYGSNARCASVRVLVSICVDGAGPFPFVLDTGASSTLFDSHFPDFVRLSADAPVSVLRRPGCTAVVLHDLVQRWSIGPVALAGQSVSVVRMPGFGLEGQPVGVLGSDVLSRFGAVRIDYAAQRLTFAGPEGPVPVLGTSVDGPTSTPVPQGLLGVGARTVVPLDVTTTASGTSVLTPVRFDTSRSFPFDVATGASTSAVTGSLAAQQGLVKTGQTEPVTSFGCLRQAPVVISGRWAMGSVALPPGLMTAAVAATSPSEAEGLVGSDALRAYGWVVLDYRSGSLFLGDGSSAA